MKNSTINYYDLNAKKYIENTINIAVGDPIKLFCSQLNPGANILDVGCGSGRDSLYFIQYGFNVVAIDASAQLAKLASDVIKQDVIVTSIENLKIENKFDAVWCMASLLHLKKSALPLAIKNCIQSLKENEDGLLFASFKIGDGESHDDNGRFFSYYQPDELKNILEKTGFFSSITLIVSEDNMGRENNWVSVIAKKKLELNLLSGINHASKKLKV
jgi:SAM-dependent methyltransferase